MKMVERILIKLILIQFVFLFLAQLFLHQLDIFPKLEQLTKYEGVNENTFTEILQTFKGN
ncbi:YpfB family protein [Neobacillus niacini]|uniref:YpfB family protein n=1 Tax=Neobacillus niacini TaxID=86668 RepID=UPI002FFEF8A8